MLRTNRRAKGTDDSEQGDPPTPLPKCLFGFAAEEMIDQNIRSMMPSPK
jgi:hypothetical protein